MPSGKTHDWITVVLAVPTALVLFFLTKNQMLTAIGVVAMMFGGLMFGPDLDVVSKQYTRWGMLRWIWWPYRKMSPHRSQSSHGIFFSTFIRVFYFLTVMTILLAVIMYIQQIFLLGVPLNFEQAAKVGNEALSRVVTLFKVINKKILIVTLVGIWWGAATHTISDFVVTTLKNASRFM